MTVVEQVLWGLLVLVGGWWFALGTVGLWEMRPLILDPRRIVRVLWILPLVVALDRLLDRGRQWTASDTGWVSALLLVALGSSCLVKWFPVVFVVHLPQSSLSALSSPNLPRLRRFGPTSWVFGSWVAASRNQGTDNSNSYAHVKLLQAAMKSLPHSAAMAAALTHLLAGAGLLVAAWVWNVHGWGAT